MLKQIIWGEQQGFVQKGNIMGNLMHVKKIIEYCQEQDVESYVIIIDFKKAYNRINQTTMIATLHTMNISEKLITLITLL